MFVCLGVCISVSVSLQICTLVCMCVCVSSKLCVCVNRGGGEEPPEGHPHRHRGVSDRLLPGVLRGVGRPHPHDALLPAGRKEPPAHGLRVRGLGPRKVLGGRRVPVCLVHQVRDRLYFPSKYQKFKFNSNDDVFSI